MLISRLKHAYKMKDEKLNLKEVLLLSERVFHQCKLSSHQTFFFLSRFCQCFKFWAAVRFCPMLLYNWLDLYFLSKRDFSLSNWFIYFRVSLVTYHVLVKFRGQTTLHHDINKRWDWYECCMKVVFKVLGECWVQSVRDSSGYWTCWCHKEQ